LYGILSQNSLLTYANFLEGRNLFHGTDERVGGFSIAIGYLQGGEKRTGNIFRYLTVKTQDIHYSYYQQ